MVEESERGKDSERQREEREKKKKRTGEQAR